MFKLILFMINDYKLYIMSPSSWPPWIVHVKGTNYWNKCLSKEVQFGWCTLCLLGCHGLSGRNCREIGNYEATWKSVMNLMINSFSYNINLIFFLNLVCNRWYMTPQTVNAYYSPSRNQIGKFIPSVSCPEKTQSYSTACYYYYYHYVHHWPSAFPLSSSSLSSLTKTLALSKLSNWFTGKEWNGHQYSRGSKGISPSPLLKIVNNWSSQDVHSLLWARISTVGRCLNGV